MSGKRMPSSGMTGLIGCVVVGSGTMVAIGAVASDFFSGGFAGSGGGFAPNCEHEENTAAYKATKPALKEFPNVELSRINLTSKAASAATRKGEAKSLDASSCWPILPHMQIRSAELITSANDLGGCPDWDVPEFALIGRSNVGKSSLVNLLTGRNGLAKVSATPGKTRLMNFFLINKQWSLVDLPGYGFAKVAKEEALGFNERSGNYIEGRHALRCVLVLIDSRHPPQRIDMNFIEWLAGTGVPYAIVFTKADKQSTGKTRANAGLFREQVGARIGVEPEILVSSAVSREGRGDVMKFIEKRLQGPA